MRKIFYFFWILGMPAVYALPSFETSAPQALLIDVSTHTVLFEKNAHTPMVPSSMTKILTAYIVFEKLKEGRLNLTTELPVSEKAWRMGGSKMFVKLGSLVTVADLLRGVIVQSGNDACIVLAEGIAGNEIAFAEIMNKKAKELGATQTHFLNATGWPEEGHTSTAHDLAIFAEKTIQNFPEDYKTYYKEKYFTYNGIKQGNRNPLLYKNLGDGLKTGHTDKGGFGLVGSYEQQGRRLLLVINGLPHDKARSQEAERLMQWGLQTFDAFLIYKADTVIEKAVVEGGLQSHVPLVSLEDIKVTVKRGDNNTLKPFVRYEGPLTAPLKKGQVVAHLVVKNSFNEEKTFPLVAAEDIECGNFFQKIWRMFQNFLGKSDS